MEAKFSPLNVYINFYFLCFAFISHKTHRAANPYQLLTLTTKSTNIHATIQESDYFHVLPLGPDPHFEPPSPSLPYRLGPCMPAQRLVFLMSV